MLETVRASGERSEEEGRKRSTGAAQDGGGEEGGQEAAEEAQLPDYTDRVVRPLCVWQESS